MNATLVLALVIAALAAVVITIHHDIIRSIERHTMSVQNQINQIVDQLRKAKDEIVDRLESAEQNIASQLVDAGVAADIIDLSELSAIAQALDDIVPDAVVDPAVDPEVDEVDEVEVDDVEVDEVDDDTDTVEVTDGHSGDAEDDE